MTVRNSFAGLPPFLFGDGGLHNQLVCDVRTYVRANDGSRDLLAPMLAWSPGPPAIGDTGDNSPSHMMGTTWLLQVCPDGSWVLYREDRGRLEVVPFDDPPDPVSPTARHVSLCFDQAARVALAWEDQGIIKVRRWDPGLNEYIENVSFAGHDPVVVFDAQWSYQIPGSDVLLFYLSPDRTRVLCRVQRDVYAVEHEVWDYGQPVILDRVVAAPIRYQVLISDEEGAPLPDALVSDLYPYPGHDKLATASTITGVGELTTIVLMPDLGVDRLTVGSLVTGSGALGDPNIDYLALEALTGEALVTGAGEYGPAFITYPALDAVAATASVTGSGARIDVVILYSAPADAINASAVVSGGGTYGPP